MRVLVACEESQATTIELRRLGHEAYSCDIEPCSGDYPEWHIQGDVKNVLSITDCGYGEKEGINFKTCNGDYHVIGEQWDMIIAHPPCTFLTNTGVCWLVGKKAKPGRWELLDDGAKFFKMFLDHPCKKIAIENPIMHKYAVERIGGKRQDQLVQPYMFGHTERKATCFWLKGLPKLTEVNNVKEEMLKLPKKEQQRLHFLPPSHDRAKLRSKTYPGIAKAMAEQWAGDNQ